MATNSAPGNLNPTQFGKTSPSGGALGSFGQGANSASSSAAPVRNPYTGQTTVNPASANPLQHLHELQNQKTSFGPQDGSYKPVNPNLNLGNELQQSSQIKGSYGNYGQKENPYMGTFTPPPSAQNPATANTASTTASIATSPILSPKPNTPNSIATPLRSRTSLPDLNPVNQNQNANLSPNPGPAFNPNPNFRPPNSGGNFPASNQPGQQLNPNNRPVNPAPPHQNGPNPNPNPNFRPGGVLNQINNLQNNPQPNPQANKPKGGFFGNNRPPQQPSTNNGPRPQPNNGPNARGPQIQPNNPNNRPNNNPNNAPNGQNKNPGSLFSNLFGGNKNRKQVMQGPNNKAPGNQIQPDKNTVEYLRNLSPTELRREIIKTEIDIQKTLLESEKAYREGVSTVRDLIAPSGINITARQLEVGTKLVRSFFVLTYPRVITMGWLEGLINADLPLDVSIFIYPRDSAEVLKELRGKVGKIQASLQLNAEQGRARDPQLETAYRDVEGLRDAIQQGVEKFFRVGIYVTIYADNQDQLEKSSQAVEGILSQQSILLKRAALQMDDGFNASLPLLKDDLEVITNMNTSPLSACFPFVSSDLSSDSGILYGINRHNSSLIIFDRFDLENANSVVFATSGAGKSFAVKLEILRSLMMGVGVIVIDPEQEYKVLADTLGGTYINMSLNSSNRINPFDVPRPLPGESNGDLLRTAIIDLMGLMNLMLGKLNPTEVSIMERAIQEAYAKRDITENSDFTNITPPTMADLVEILQGIVGGESLAQRLYRYTEGTFAGIFNKQTNVNMKNELIVFNIRDLQEELRPIAMYILLKYVWTEIRSNLKKRILAIDEAWIMMQYEDSARFLFGLAKRARKYYLGITTITQDVGDFLNSPLGKPIVTNAAMKILLKQSTAAIDQVAETFALTSGEKQVLLQSEVGQGIFFAGPRHVAIEVIAFPTEHRIITTNPKDILKMQGLE